MKFEIAVPAAAIAVLSLALAAAPAAAQKAGGAGKTAEQKKFTSAADIAKAFAAERKDAEKALKEKELNALQTYLKGKVEDKEKALFAAQEIASELEKWADVKSIADQYLADFASSDEAPQVKLAKANAISNSGGAMADALKLYGEVADGAGENKQLVFNAHMLATDAQLDAGDTAGALASLDKLEKALSGIPQVGQIVMNRRAEISSLGTAPKPFEVKDEKGAALSLEQFKGKVVLLDFWATWCGPCREELPNVLATYAKHHGNGFEIVGVSLDEDEKAFREFIAAEGMTWRHHFDGKGWANEIAQLYGVQSIPATYLLDRDGKIARIGLRGEALDKAVAKLLEKKPTGN